MSSPEDVLSYWFPEDDIFDADQETFGRQMVLEQARRGELDHWADTLRGRLALIVVLDQFSRTVYRGSPLSYSQDEKALELAVEGIDAGMDRELTPMERTFFWMPLGHSEDPTHQEQIVHHREEEAANAPPHLRAMTEFGISLAKGTRDVIARFGRHPHRNEILGRASTPEEREYLRTETPPHLRRPPS
jgi:uncharacterized protein (DUF924 family)